MVPAGGAALWLCPWCRYHMEGRDGGKGAGSPTMALPLYATTDGGEWADMEVGWEGMRRRGVIFKISKKSLHSRFLKTHPYHVSGPSGH